MTDTSTPTTYEFAGLRADARDALERHLRAVGFDRYMSRRDRGGRREAARCRVTLSDAGHAADLLFLAEAAGLSESQVTDATPGTVYLWSGVGISADDVAGRLALPLADLLDLIEAS